MGRGSWPDAVQRLDRAFGIFARGWDEAVTPEARKEIIAAASRAGAWSAVADVAAGEYARAFERLEASRAIMLREALADDEVQLRELPVERRETVNRTRRRIAQLRAEAGLLQGEPERYLALAEELKEARATLTAELAGMASSRQSLSIDAILAAIPDGSILIVPAATAFGSVIFIVPAGTKRLDRRHVVELPDLAATAVREQLERWLDAYTDALGALSSSGRTPEFERRWQAASDVLEEVLAWLGRTVFEPALKRVREFGSPEPEADKPKLLMMPTGDFVMLPLHAAVCANDGTTRAVLEDYVVSYTPSLHALHTAWERQGRLALSPGQEDLLALVNPTGDLQFSESMEVPALRRLFPNARADAIRVGATASKAALIQQGRGRRYVHLSCHGRFIGWDPEASGIALAAGEWMTAREVASVLQLDGSRWVMVAGCETAMMDVGQLPDEAVGQVGAFLMAGAPCVIGALWAVPDASAALFVTKAYEGHLCAGLTPAMAVRQAALWLRDVSAEELAHLVPRNDQPDAGALRFAEIGAAEPAAKFPPSGSKPFRSPLFWAAFAAWGV